jgi:hypothetical protein
MPIKRRFRLKRRSALFRTLTSLANNTLVSTCVLRDRYYFCSVDLTSLF